MKRKIGNIEVTCKNLSKGCQETVKIKDLPEHENFLCEYSQKTCVFQGCTATIFKKDFHQHCK